MEHQLQAEVNELKEQVSGLLERLAKVETQDPVVFSKNRVEKIFADVVLGMSGRADPSMRASISDMMRLALRGAIERQDHEESPLLKEIASIAQNELRRLNRNRKHVAVESIEMFSENVQSIMQHYLGSNSRCRDIVARSGLIPAPTPPR